MEMGDGDGWVGAGDIVALWATVVLHANRRSQIDRLLV